MRLTLRTLLAYLDEVLDPGDAEELSAKISESDFANGLVHRIRNSVGRLRLSCPPPLAKGLAEDANSVGEYIDSTLPEDRIADFERACLESDMHLAEVSACHQIVTWIVREPADVDQGMRERIRALGEVQDSQNTSGYRRVDEALASLDHGGEEDGQASDAAATKPDYMTAGRRRNSATRWVVTAVVAGFLLTAGFLIWTAGKNNQQQVGELPLAVDETLATPVADAGDVDAGDVDASDVDTSDVDASALEPAGPGSTTSDLASNDSAIVDRSSDFMASSTPPGCADDARSRGRRIRVAPVRSWRFERRWRFGFGYRQGCGRPARDRFTHAGCG